jgi:hypothetical protein
LPTREEEHLSHEPLENVNFEQLNEGINTYISQEEILSCIKKLKNNKVSGEDHIVNEYIKLLFKISKNENNVEILSVVEYDFLNPNWFSSNKKTSSDNTRSLSFKTALNSLPRQLRM